MRIIAIDTATKTGWATIDGGRVVESGVQDFTRRRGESTGMLFLKFRKWLTELVEAFPPDVVVYEQSHHRGGAATEIGVNLTGRVQEIATENGLEYASVHTSSLKKWVTGSGTASKADMIEAAKEVLGRDPIDDNEADAVHIGMWATSNYDAKSTW